MFKRLFGRSQRPLDLISARKGEDRQEFAELLGRAQIFCICMTPGLEKGIDPNISLEEVPDKIRERFEPFCYVKDSQRRMPLFTGQSLVREFARFAEGAGKNIRDIGKGTLEQLNGYRWLGNIRELQNVVERVVILSETVSPSRF